MNGKGSMREDVLQNFRIFFGKKQNDKDAEKYAKVLESMSFPELSGYDTESLYRETEEALGRRYPAQGGDGSCASHLAVTGLGRKQRKNAPPEETERQMLKQAEQMAHMLAAYEEELAVTLWQTAEGEEERKLRFVLSGETGIESVIPAMARSVYGRAETEQLVMPAPLGHRIYAAVTMPDSGGQAETVSQPEAVAQSGTAGSERNCLPWVSALAFALPAGETCSACVRLIPAERDDTQVQARIAELEMLYDKLQFCSEINWNASSNLGSNYSRNENLLEETKLKFTSATHGAEEVSSSYGWNLGMGRSQKNNRAAYLMRRVEKELARLRRAQQSAVWRVEISVTAQSEAVLQTVACTMSGALKPCGMEFVWSERPCTAFTAGTREILPFLLFPTREFAGFMFLEQEEFALLSPEERGDGLDMGRILWNGTPVSPFYLPRQALNRHAFICGMTGAGKTNTVFRLLEEIVLPYLVIEPVKGEYRSLRGADPGVKVWTMKAGDGQSADTAMLRINPFWFPENANIAFHIDSIKTIIASAFEMSAAMPNILEQCLYRVYVKAGWDLTANRNVYRGQVPEEFLYPTFSDLQEEIDDYLDHAAFGDEVLGNYRGAMSARMKSFINGFKGLLLNTDEHPDYGQFMKGCNIIELEGLADDADKCLVMGTILVQYFEYLKLHFKKEDKQLQHITVIEEAHRLFKNVQKKGNTQEGADAAGQLVESLSNIMAEIRAFGEGILVVDQSPSKIAEDVIKNSGTKLIHRIDHEQDIRMMQACLLIPEDMTSIPILRQGEALVRTEGMAKPCKVRVYCSELKEAYSLSQSFQGGQGKNKELGIVFAATAILADETVKKEMSDCIVQFLTAFVRSDGAEWYAVTERFMLELIGILQERKQYDMVGSRLAVMFELVSRTIKGMRGTLSVLETGRLHLFVMRVLALYQEQREGYCVKEGAVELLQSYLERYDFDESIEYRKELRKEKFEII